MQILLTRKTEALLADRMKLGGYASPEDVVLAGLVALEQQSLLGDFEAGEMDRLLAEGEASGTPLDGEGVLRELRQLRSGH